MAVEAFAARTLRVDKITESSVALSFGVPDEKAYGLYLAHGSSDAGEDKGAWDGFEKVADILADQTTFVYEVPEELRDGRFLRFFLLQTSGVQYAKEFKSIKSTGAQWIDVGIPPTSSWIVDFRFGNVEVANDKALWGQNWSGTKYLFCTQDSSGIKFRFFGKNGTVVGTPVADRDYRCVVDPSSTFVLFDNGSESRTKVDRSVNGTGNFALFAVNDGNKMSSYTFYRMKIADGKKGLLRDFIPAANSAGDVGLYDQVNDIFYKSKTSTQFVAGEEIVSARFGRVIDATPTFKFKRSLSVSSVSADAISFKFGNPSGESMKLYVAYGSKDGKDDKYAWDNYAEIATIAGDATEYVYELPASLKASGTFYRFFLVKTDGLPYEAELSSITSTAKQLIRLNYLPGVDTTVVFRFGGITYENQKAFFGQHWDGSGFLLNMQSDSLRFHGSGSSFSEVSQGDYLFMVTSDNKVILKHNNLVYNVAESRATYPILDLCVFSTFSADVGGRCSKYRFDSMLVKDGSLVVRDLVPVTLASGKAGFFDRANGVVIPNVRSTDFTKGNVLGRTGWIHATTATYAASEESSAKFVLPASFLRLEDNLDLSSSMASIEDGMTFDLNGHELRISADSEFFWKAVNFIGESGTLRIDVKAGEEFYFSPGLEALGKINIVKEGDGTLVLKCFCEKITGITVERGIIKYGKAKSMPAGITVKVLDGASFDMNGYVDNCVIFDIAGTGPDGRGALRNMGSDIGNGSAQCAGIILSADATIYSTAHFGLINSGYDSTVLELNGHVLTLEYGNEKGFWLANTSGSSKGTVYVKSGIPYFFGSDKSVNLPNVDFVVDGAKSIFRVASSSAASKIVIGSLTVSNGAKFEEQANITRMKKLNLYGNATVSDFVKWIYVSDTILVSNDVSQTATIWPPICDYDGSYSKIVKQGAGTLIIKNNHSDQRIDGGVEVQGGTVVMDSKSGTKAHIAISSKSVPVMIRNGGTLDMTKCTEPFKVKSLVIEEGGVLAHTSANVLDFTEGAGFANPEPFAFAGKVKFAGTVKFDLSAYYAKEGAPAAGSSFDLFKAGSLEIPEGSSVEVTGCPYGYDVLVKADSIVLKTKTEAEEALKPIKIWAVGDDVVLGANGANFRGGLAALLSQEGWNIKMTGWRKANATGGCVGVDAWKWHSGIANHTLKTSATRAGILEGLETFAAAAEYPDFTVFACGRNDVADGVANDVVLANYKAAVNRIKAALPMTTVLACTIPGAGEELNGAIKAWCEGEALVEAVDIAAVMTADLAAAEFSAAAEVLKEKLMTLATAQGKKNPSAWAPPAVKLGAENNVPAEYRSGFVRVRSIENPKTGYSQNLYAIPYAYAPAMQESGIEKVGYYIEFVRKDTGALQAMWIDMDAPGSNWADVALPVTIAQQKQCAVSKLHVWSNFGGVSAVPASDDSVTGYIEFNPLSYAGGEKNVSGAIAEPWSGAYGFDDSFETSGTSGHACFQIMRKFADSSVFPGGEILFAYNNWGKGESDTRAQAIGMGTLADYGHNGYTSAKSLDWTFAGDDGAESRIGVGAYSFIRIDFWVKYSEVSSRQTYADYTWTGNGGTDFATASNWGSASEAASSIADSVVMLPEGVDQAFTYIGYDPIKFKTTTFMVDGIARFNDVGGFYLAGLDVGAQGKLVYDPVKFTFRFVSAPVFASGAKIALDAAYQANTRGRFLLMTWDKGSVDMTDEVLTSLFDVSSASGSNVKVWAENFEKGGGRLWLDLDYGAARRKINVLCVGDSITQGSDSSYGNWRIALMKRLAAAGYEPVSKGFWTIQSHDICGAEMPAEWINHSGISGQRLSSKSSSGTIDQIEATLDQAGDVDFVLVKLGTNDINSNGATADDLFPVWKELVGKVLEQKPHAKFVAGAVVDIAYDTMKNAQVVAYNAKMKAAIDGGEFAEKRVYFADLYTPCYRYDENGSYITGSFYGAENLHPDWPGEDKMAQVYMAAIMRAISEDSAFVLGEEDANLDTSMGVETNIPEEYRKGMTRACVLDVAANNTSNLAVLGKVPYSEVNPDAAIENISRVGYYIELKRKNSAVTDYHGLVRYLWVSMDAFGNRTIEDVGVPLNTVSQCSVNRLRVKTNMSGIESTSADANDYRGWIEFWPSSYSNPASNSSAPKEGWGYDWNDTRSNNMNGFGSMQVHRLTEGASNAAEVLFAFNHWTTGDSNWEIGFGNFSHNSLGSIDWTFTGSSDKNMVETMSAAAYEVARIEIWTASAEADEDVPGAVVSVTDVVSDGSDVVVKGKLETLGLSSESATVELEWSTDPTFATINGSKSVGSYTQTGALSVTVSGLDQDITWYFRFKGTDDDGRTSVSDSSDPFEPVSGYWRASSESDNWTSMAWLKRNVGSLVAFDPSWSAVFDGNEGLVSGTVSIPESVAANQVFVDSAKNYLFTGAGSVTSSRLVKDGEGTLELDGAVLAGTPDIEVRKGIVKISDTASKGAAGSDGGTITVRNGGQIDVNYYDTTAAKNTARAQITSKKKFVIEGAGPDGSGAIVSSRNSTPWNSAFDEIELTGDATIGGEARIEVRENAKNIVHGPENATLTIKTNPGTSNYYEGFGLNGTLSVGKLVIAEEGRFKLEGDNFVIDVPRGIDLYGKLGFWTGSGTWRSGDITVMGKAAAIANYYGTAKIGAPVTVSDNAVLTLDGGNTLSFENVLTNKGEIVVVNGSPKITGGFVNEGNPVIKSSRTITISSDIVKGDSRLEMSGGYAWMSGKSDWGDAALDITLSDGGTMVWGINDDGYGFPKFAKNKVNVTALEGHSGIFHLHSSVSDSIDGLAIHGPLRTFLAQGPKTRPVSVTLSDFVVESANKFEVGTGSGYGEFTLKGAGSSISANTLVVDNVGSTTYSGMLYVKDGLLAVGSGGILTGFLMPNRSLLVMENGIFRANESFSLMRPGMTASFGTPIKGGAVEFDLNGKSVTWQTSLTGASDVTLKGEGSFLTGRPGIQGIPTGKWTVEKAGEVDLRNAAGFAGGISLGENSSATLDIAGESMVEMLFWNWGGNAWNTMKPLYEARIPVVPHIATSLTYINRAASQIIDTKTSSGTGINYFGEFYVSEEQAGTWYFSHSGYSHNGLTIDNTIIDQAGTNSETKDKSIELSAGWHKFMISLYTGSDNPTIGPKSGNSLSATESYMFKVGNDGVYAPFDTTSLPMRMRNEATARTSVRWRKANLYDNSASKYLSLDESEYTALDAVTNSLVVLNSHYNKGAAAPLGGAASRFDGYFRVGSGEGGIWTFKGQFDDRVALFVDGKKVFATTGWSNSQEASLELREGWHKFEIYTCDSCKSGTTSGESGGKLSYDSKTCAVAFKIPSGSYKPFDERYLPIASSAYDAQKFEKPGLGGEISLAKGSVLKNEPRQGGWCPVYGTLKGAGTLDGPFRFTGGNNAWEVSGTGRKDNLEGMVAFSNPDPMAFKDLKRVKITLEKRPARYFYPFGEALGMTSELAGGVALTVLDADGENVTQGFSLGISGGKFGLFCNRPDIGFRVIIR